MTRTVSVMGISMPKLVNFVPITRVPNENVDPDSAQCGGRNLRRMLRKYAVTGATHSPTEAHPAGLARQSTTVHPAVSARAEGTGRTKAAAQIPVHRRPRAHSVLDRTAVRIKVAHSIGRAGAACRIGHASVTIRIRKRSTQCSPQYRTRRLKRRTLGLDVTSNGVPVKNEQAGFPQRSSRRLHDVCH